MGIKCWGEIMNEQDKIVLKIQKLEHCAGLPEYKTEGAAGMDLVASCENDIVLKSLERFLVPTGIKIELPHGYEAQIRPRSGLSIKHGISLINCVGTVDEDYRGEVKVGLVKCFKRLAINFSLWFDYWSNSIRRKTTKWLK